MHFVIALLLLLLKSINASLHPKKSSINNDTSVCGYQRIFSDATGTIKSPGYPSRYPSNVFCSYDIIVQNDQRVELTWNDFDIDGNMPNCDAADSDYLEIHTGCGSSRRYLTKFCSSNAASSHPLYSVDNCLTLHLYTKPVSLAKVSRGFSAVYKAVNRNQVLLNQRCNRSLSENVGIIHSTYWPQSYNKTDWDNCNWHLKLDGNMAVRFTFMDLDSYCSYSSYYQSCNQYCSWYNRDEVSLQGIASLYNSVGLRKNFYGKCRPFAYQTSYSEFVISWRKRPSFSNRKQHGFILGYVAYRPVNERSFFATWQFGLVIFCGILAAIISFVFGCRHGRLRETKERGNYTLLVNVGTDTDDIDRTGEDNEGPGVRVRGAASNIPDNENETQVRNYGSTDSITPMDDQDDLHMTNFADPLSLSHVSADSDGQALICGQRSEVNADSSRIEVLFHPNPTNIEALRPQANPASFRHGDVRLRPRSSDNEVHQANSANMFLAHNRQPYDPQDAVQTDAIAVATNTECFPQKATVPDENTKGNIDFPARNPEYPYQNPDHAAQNNEYSARKSEFPDRNMEYSDSNTDYPDQNIEDSIRNLDYPDRNADRPAQNMEHSTRNSDYPDRNADLPAQNMEHSTRNLDYPDRNADRPAQNMEHSTRNSDYPDRNADHPAQNMDHSTRNLDYPDRNAEQKRSSDGNLERSADDLPDYSQLYDNHHHAEAPGRGSMTSSQLPAYDEIYDELQSLSLLVGEIMSDLGQESQEGQ